MHLYSIFDQSYLGTSLDLEQSVMVLAVNTEKKVIQ
jgi:hypothetical protein